MTTRLPLSFLLVAAFVFTAKLIPNAHATGGVFGGNPGVIIEADPSAGYTATSATAVLDRVTWRNCTNNTYFTQRYGQSIDLAAGTIIDQPLGNWCEVQLVFGSLLAMSGEGSSGSYSITASTKTLTLPVGEGASDYETLAVVQRLGGVFGGNPGLSASYDVFEE